MELMTILGAITAAGAEPDVPDARDPVTAAAFADLLAGLLPHTVGVAPVVATPEPEAASSAPATGAAVGMGAAVSVEWATVRPTEPGAAPIDDVAATPFARTLEAAALARVASDPVGTTEPTAATAGPTESAEPAANATTVEPSGQATVADIDADPAAEPARAGSTSGAASAVAATHDPAQAEPASTVLDTADPASAPRHLDATDPSLVNAATRDVMSSRQAAPATAAGPTPVVERRAQPTRDRVDGGVHAVAGPPRSDAAAHTAGPEAASAVPVSRTLERVLAVQLAERVGDLRQSGDGDYELTLQLDPADLGHLELRVRLEGGLVHVHVDAQSAATGDLMRRALPELRDALLDAGLAAGSLDVGHQPAGREAGAERQADTTPLEPAARHRSSQRHQARPSVPVRSAVDRGVDVLL